MDKTTNWWIAKLGNPCGSQREAVRWAVGWSDFMIALQLLYTDIFVLPSFSKLFEDLLISVTLLDSGDHSYITNTQAYISLSCLKTKLPGIVCCIL